jgi:deoxyribose-phosphate aldolase
MDRASFAARVYHAVLGPETTLPEVYAALDTAAEYGTPVRLPPCYAAEAVEYAPGVTVEAVCGYPQGQTAPSTKEFGAERAWKDGVDGIAVVINVGRLRAGDDGAALEELERVVAAVPVPVTVIVDAPLLSVGELRTACELAAEAGAAFVETATADAGGGAAIEDVEIMAEYLPVAANGGIGSFEAALAMFEAGADRVVTPDGAAVLEGFDAGAIGASTFGSERP